MTVARLKKPVVLLLVAAAYAVAGKLGLRLAFIQANATAVWPPTGIALAAALIFGYWVWPAVFAGAFLVNLTTAGTVATSLSLAGGNTLEALAGAWLVNRFANGWEALDRPQDFLKFAVLGGLAAPVVSSAVGVTTLSLAGFSPWSSYGPVWLTWWLGDVGGALAVAPLLIAFSRDARWDWSPRKSAEAGLLLAALIASAGAVFGPGFSAASRHLPIAHFCYPVLIWAAFRFGVREAAVAASLLSAAALRGTLEGFGPFVRPTPHESLLLLQTFIVLIFLISLLIATAVAQGSRAELRLRRLNEELESKVRERSEQLLRKQGELVVSQKLEALGRLAGGIAHEFNNLLTGILGLANLVKGALGPEHPCRADMEKIGDVSRQAASLVGRLLVIGRQRKRNVSAMDLNATIEASRNMLAAAMGERVEVRTKLARGLPAVLADAGELDQILMNLCLNARDAMSGTGRLELETQGVSLAAPMAASHGTLKAGSYVLLKVQDSGAGIPKEDQFRIFDPFFTTKEVGLGTGLGLSIVYAIIQDLGGGVEVFSEQGRGTLFSVYLPAAPAKFGMAPAADPSVPQGRETLLLAEDQPAVLESVSRLLKSCGYDVLAAKDGEEALSLFEANKDKVELSILDLVMPKLHGLEAFEAIRGRKPRAKVLYISGYVSAQAEEALRAQDAVLLPKPFSPEDLARAVRRALDS